MRLDPLRTWSAHTGAICPLTTQVLSETYLAPCVQGYPLAAAMADMTALWSQSLAVAPDEMLRNIARAMAELACATPGLTWRALNPEALPEGRARSHLTALRDLWAHMDDALSEDLAIRSPSATPALHGNPERCKRRLNLGVTIPNPFGIPLGSTPQLESATYQVSFKHVPNPHPDLITYAGSWSPNGGMNIVVGRSKLFPDDPSGSAAVLVYDRLKRQLQKIYGHSRSFEGTSIFDCFRDHGSASFALSA